MYLAQPRQNQRDSQSAALLQGPIIRLSLFQFIAITYNTGFGAKTEYAAESAATLGKAAR
jgi:hypothetical protein